MNLPLCAVTAASLLLAPAPQAQTVVKMHVIGDSITESSDGFASWRYYLDQHLTNGGYAFDFVGHNSGVFGGTPLYPGFDQDHEAYSGWRCEHIALDLERWTQEVAPDIALIHLGTNDLIANQGVASTVAELETLIDILRAVNPEITVLVAKIIPMVVPPFKPWRDVTPLNAAIGPMAAAKDTPESRVIAVDHHAAVTLAMLHDGLHPNDTGEQAMAQTWFDALKPFITPVTLEFTKYGAGCAGTAPAAPEIAAIRGQAAAVGYTFTVKFSDVPISGSAYGMLGFDDQFIGGAPLPLDLGILGATGCSLWTGPEITYPLASTGGTAVWTLVIPDDQILVGTTVFQQCAVIAPGVNTFGMIVSDAAEVNIVDKQ